MCFSLLLFFWSFISNNFLVFSFVFLLLLSFVSNSDPIFFLSILLVLIITQYKYINITYMNISELSHNYRIVHIDYPALWLS